MNTLVLVRNGDGLDDMMIQRCHTWLEGHSIAAALHGAIYPHRLGLLIVHIGSCSYDREERWESHILQNSLTRPDPAHP